MTTQRRDSRSQIEQFTRNLQQAVQELERRRQLMETVLVNIPTGVISLDAAGAILRVNSSVSRMFGAGSSEEHTSELQSHLNLVCRLLLAKKNRGRRTRPPQRRGDPAAPSPEQWLSAT